MRGSPLLRVLLVGIALLAVLWPLRSLTTHRTEESPDISQKATAGWGIECSPSSDLDDVPFHV